MKNLLIKYSAFLFILLLLKPVVSAQTTEFLKKLTQEEKQWLNQNKERTLSYAIPPRYTPVSFIEDDQPKGMVKD